MGGWESAYTQAPPSPAVGRLLPSGDNRKRFFGVWREVSELTGSSPQHRVCWFLLKAAMGQAIAQVTPKERASLAASRSLLSPQREARRGPRGSEVPWVTQGLHRKGGETVSGRSGDTP